MPPWPSIGAALVAGSTRSFAPINAEQAQHWTTSYPTAALFPMARLIRAGARSRLRRRHDTLRCSSIPPADQVIDPALIPPVANAWGGPTDLEPRDMQGDDDPFAHVIAGDILSPGQTEPVIAIITEWARGL